MILVFTRVISESLADPGHGQPTLAHASRVISRWEILLDNAADRHPPNVAQFDTFQKLDARIAELRVIGSKCTGQASDR
jgi:hypothetical protein